MLRWGYGCNFLLKETHEESQQAHLLSIPAGVCQPQSFTLGMRDARPLPDDLVKPTLAAVKGIGPIVGCQLVLSPLQIEHPLGYPICHPSYHSSKVEATVTLQRLEAINLL